MCLRAAAVSGRRADAERGPFESAGGSAHSSVLLILPSDLALIAATAASSLAQVPARRTRAFGLLSTTISESCSIADSIVGTQLKIVWGNVLVLCRAPTTKANCSSTYRCDGKWEKMLKPPRPKTIVLSTFPLAIYHFYPAPSLAPSNGIYQFDRNT